MSVRRGISLVGTLCFLMCAWLGLTAAGGSAQGTSDGSAPLPRPRDWPPEHSSLQRPYQRWWQINAAEALRRRAPGSPQLVGWFVDADRADDALGVLARVIADRPDQIAAALEGAERLQMVMAGNRGAERMARLRELLTAARTRIAELPREAQAEAAMAILPLEYRVDSSIPYPDRVRQFVQAYDGTQAALLMSVDVAVGVRLSPASLQALDEFVARAPGTTAAAKALFRKASNISRNFQHVGRGALDSDPTERFLEVASIANDLETGGYPPSRWVRDAPGLVAEFSFFRAKLSPQSADRVLATLLAFARGHVAWLKDPERQEAFVSFVSSSVLRVAVQMADGPATATRVAAELERVAPDPAAVRYAVAQFHLNALEGPPTPANQAAGIEALTRAAEMGSGVFARKALAWRAELDYLNGRYAPARDGFVEYVRRYPTSDYAWMAALRAGQADLALGRAEPAARTLADAATRFDAVPFARVLGHAYAAQAFETAGDLDAALVHYRGSVAAWPADLGEQLGANGRYSMERAARLEPDPATITRDALVRRADQLATFLPVDGGHALEQARGLLLRGRADEAVPLLQDVVERHRGSPAGTEARTVLNRARLDTALAPLSESRTAATLSTARTTLAALAREPFDPAVGTADIASATILMLQGQRTEADAALRGALDRWVDGHARRGSPASGTLEADVVAIRDAVFRPGGGGVLNSRWNAHEWPARPPEYLVTPATLRVTVPGQPLPVRVDVTAPPPGLDKVLFMTDDEVEGFTRLVPRLGGTGRREPTGVMETPHQPIGDAQSIVSWWNGFFPARPGHWGGFEVLTYPVMRTIEFGNAERTRAFVPITVGYSGATVVLEKVRGVWTMVELTNMWVT